MIVYENGHYRTIRTPKENTTLIKQDLARLTPAEKEALKVILADIQKNKPADQPNLLATLSESELRDKPVDMKTFIYDKYFLGNTCENTYPRVCEALTDIFSGGYQMAILSGSIGWGKSFGASIGICRILYELSLMKDPHKSLGIASGSQIALVVFSVTEALAIRVAFENIITKIEGSPYFQENFPFEQTKRELRFPNNIWVSPRATTDNSALGLNVLSFFMDEVDFINTPGKKHTKDLVDRSDAIFNTLMRRMKTRFERKGKLPSVAFIVSSKNTTTSFSARLLAKSMNDPLVYVADETVWTAKPKGTFSSETFKVLVGNEQVPSRIVDDQDLEKYKDGFPDGCVVTDVPVDFRADFERDLDSAIRDIAGIATISIAPFIQRREKILEAVELDRQVYGDRKHPFTAEEFEPGKDGQFMWDRMVQKRQERGFMGYKEDKYRPIINPTAVRAIHIDPSISGDATGLCVAHISGRKEVLRRAADGSEYRDLAPIYTVDLILRVIPPTGGEIILADMRQFIYDFSAHGYIIGKVTLDSWNSVDTIQTLSSKGYSAELLSVDKTLDPYENLKTSLYEGRILMYHYEPLFEELRTIQKDLKKKKVDHPDTGCFVADTRIPLLDGSDTRIADLDGKECWVYASNAEGRIVPAKATGRLTKYVTDLVDVVLDSGATVRCTPDHPWRLRTGEYKAAKDLRPGIDRLLPINRIWPINGGYEKISDFEGTKITTHQMVWTFFNGPVPDGFVIHHKNHIKIDNRPENLEAGPLSTHSKYHTELRHQTDPDWRNKLYTGAKRFNESNEGRRKHSEALKKTMASLTKDGYIRRSRLREAFRSDININKLEQIKTDKEAVNANVAARILNCGRNVVIRVLRDHGFGSWEEFVKAEPGLNHKVKGIYNIKLDSPVPVYDLEVAEFSNFALSAGVFVHNSKDLSDSLAGCLFTLSQNQAQQPMPIVRASASQDENWMPLQTDYVQRGGSNDRIPVWQDMLPPFFTGSGRKGGGGDGGF